MPVSAATVVDIPELVALINSAYRGETSKKGWTTEADLLSGELRTDDTMLAEIFKDPANILLKYVEGGRITGSVYLKKQEKGLYLGMLTVSPELQSAGIGKKLMRAAEDFAKENMLPCIFMNVISVRDELISWYERQGYYKTGERKPLPDSKYGTPTRPLEFAIMQKDL
jgi:ribosomal protein S18 acetylase RimI-like enzyme